LPNITLQRKIFIKAIVTQDFKNTFNQQLESYKTELNANIEKIKTEESRLLLSGSLNSSDTISYRAKLSKEREQQEIAKKEIEEKAKEINSLEIGSVYPYLQLDSLVEVKEGDNLFEKLNAGEITIRDGVIIAIRS
jgi:hypothetical protein